MASAGSTLKYPHARSEVSATVNGTAVPSDAMTAGDVSATLRRLRSARQLTQSALAHLAHVSQKTVSEIESGKRQAPTPLVVGKLDVALGAEGQLLERLERSRDDQASWQSVLSQFEELQDRLTRLEAGQQAIVERLDQGGGPAEGVRQWVIALAAYGESMTEREREMLISLARQMADKHALPAAT